jgi:dTDP-4-amino-4,6-dideoxygalactose transaminase
MEKIKYLDLKKINKKILDQTKKKIITQLYSGKYILDSNVKIFEKNFASFNKVKFCVGVNSGHDAIKIALKSLNLKPGDKVFVPALTFISTWYAVSELGGQPIPVDVKEDTGVIDEKRLPDKIDKKIKGIIAVNLYGNLCNFKFLKKYCKSKKIFLLEDSSQSHGAYYKKNIAKKIFSDISCFSFYPGKNLGSITDGGAIVTNKKELYIKSLYLRNYGCKKKYYHNYIGYNSRLNSSSAIFLNEKIKFLSQENIIRKEKEEIYNKYFKKIKSLKILKRNPEIESSHHIFIILTKYRNALLKFLKQKGIETIVHYPKLPSEQPLYKSKFKKSFFRNAKMFSNQGISLPLSSSLSHKDQFFIIKNITNFFNNI